MANISTTQGGMDSLPMSLPTAGPRVDFATILGVVGAFTLIIAAMFLGGSADAFFNVPSILIVVGGTFLVTTVSFTLGEVVRAQAVMLKAVVYHASEPGDAAAQVLHLADAARKKGALALQNYEQDFANNRILQRAMQLVIDGTPGEEVERVMLREVEATRERHGRAAGVLRRAGEVAPAMGLIGTLIGLVQMLRNLDDPTAIGPAMAVALLTTFYGAVMAHMIFLPVANKLERNADAEATVNLIYAHGAASIGRQENPRRLQTFLNTMLSPSQRLQVYG